MNDILLGALILFSGFVPVAIALWYSNKLLIIAQNLQETSQEAINKVPKRINDAMYSDKFSEHMRQILSDSMRGAYGKQVQEATKQFEAEGRLAGLPPPVKTILAKGAGNYLGGYGVSKKTITDGIMALLNRPSRQQMEQQGDLIRQYANDVSPVYDVNGPRV